MDGKADNFLHAFDGLALDWNAALGSDFVGVPGHYVSVYRECGPDELIRIVREGLSVPPPETRHPDMRQEMELLDRYRPPRVIEQGISRVAAIYAVPTSDTPKLPFRRERYVIEMKIDPAEAYVGDMDFITCLIPFIGANRTGLDKYGGAFEKYWESVIPLTDFFRHYRRTETDDGDQWIASPRAPRQLPKAFFVPEILVMTPIVSRRHIRVIGREPVSAEDADPEHGKAEPHMTWEDER